MKGSSIPREAEAPVASLLSEMEKELLGILKNTELSSYFQESFLASGKRIRPLFFFLLSGSLGASRPDLADYGLILELLHASSLIHDDIIDHSDQRRGMASFNNSYGNQTAVFLGDFLMWATQKLALSKGDLKLLQLLNQRGEEMLLGEVQEIRNHRNLRISPGEYGEIITRKTGSLFLLAAQMAAHLSQVAPERGEALERLGTLVGILFQLVDDLLDITSDSGSFGKSERKGSSANSDGAIRRGGRCGAGCCVSCIRAGRIHYRAGALRRRRHGDVIIIAPLEKEEV